MTLYVIGRFFPALAARERVKASYLICVRICRSVKIMENKLSKLRHYLIIVAKWKKPAFATWLIKIRSQPLCAKK
jgi:hypothetical protein